MTPAGKIELWKIRFCSLNPFFWTLARTPSMEFAIAMMPSRSSTREPQRARPFRTPWVPLLPGLGALACLWLMFGLPWSAWIQFSVWLAIGAGVYALYGYRRSRLSRNT